MSVRWLSPTRRFDALAISIYDFGATGTLSLAFDCKDAVFGPADREELRRNFLGLLRMVLEDSGRRLDEVSDAIARGAGRVAPAPLPDGEVPMPPRTDLERSIAAIWSEMLGVESVRRDEGFLDLGGDSLLVYRMFARIRAELGVELVVERFLAEPTIEGLTAAIAIAMGRVCGEHVERALREVEALTEDEATEALTVVESSVEQANG
jgi:acyl carrier protein